MIHNILKQGCFVPGKACGHCHFAVKTQNDHQFAAHCLIFNAPIYEDELYDGKSCLRKLCCEHGDYFTSILANISKTDLFEWRILHDNNALSRKEKHVFTIAEIIRTVVALLALFITFYKLY